MAFRNIIVENPARIHEHLPKNGAIRMLTITEKQYESIEILLGPLCEADLSFEAEVLSVF